MWRSLLLGKLAISIVAALYICAVCYRIAQAPETGPAALKWYLLSGFFLLVGVSFSTVSLLMFRKPKLRKK